MVANKNTHQHPPNAKKEDNLGTRRRVLTIDDIKDYSIATLGYPQVTVDVDELQFEVFWEVVLDEYNKWLPIQKTGVLNAVASPRSKYDLDALNKPYGRGIIDVRIASRERFFSSIGGVFNLGIPHPISHLSPEQYDLALRYINTAKKIYSSEPDFEWEEPILWLYTPSGFGGPFIAAYTYNQDVSFPEDIPQEDWAWVKKYFRTYVKEAVGEARGKFSSIPGPAGQSLRGEAMASEALEERAKLEELIETKSYGRVPPSGPASIG